MYRALAGFVPLCSCEGVSLADDRYVTAFIRHRFTSPGPRSVTEDNTELRVRDKPHKSYTTQSKRRRYSNCTSTPACDDSAHLCECGY